MINININGEKVIITEKTALKDLIAVDCYPVLDVDNNKIMLPIPELPDKDLAKCHLYVAGIVTADKLGNMEVMTDKITFKELTWDGDWDAWLGVYVDGDFDEYDKKAGIKIFFGGC